jgi:hypothetical protein
MGTVLVPETSENLYSFGATKLPAHPEDGDEVTFTTWRGCLPDKKFIEFCRQESFRIDKSDIGTVQYISCPPFSFSFFYLKVSMFI